MTDNDDVATPPTSKRPRKRVAGPRSQTRSSSSSSDSDSDSSSSSHPYLSSKHKLASWKKANKELARENKELARENKELARENKELARENKELARENKELLKKNLALASEKEELKSLNKTLATSLDELNNLCKRERDQNARRLSLCAKKTEETTTGCSASYFSDRTEQKARRQYLRTMKEMEEEGPIKLWTQSPLWNKLTTGESEKKQLQPAFSELITSLEKGSCGLIHLQDTHSTGFKLGKHHVKPGAVGLMTARAHPIPLEVAFFVELKSKKLPIEKAVGQVVRYCVILMKQCPPVFRERAVGVATNGRDTRLIEVTRDDIETQNYQCFNFDEFPLAQLLGTLLSQNKEFLLGANSLEPFEFNGETILPERPLSHGATSRVFVDNYKKVWKVARDEALFPVLEKEADLLQRFFREHITGVPTVTGQVSHGFCMEECGTLLRENRLLLRGLSHQYVDTLKLVGALNYVHRDLRPANLLVCNGKALIIDWGFAVCCGINGYQGTIRYASFRVWKQLSANQFTVGTPTYVQLADDLESLVLSIAALSVAGYDKTVLGTQLQDIWTNVWDPIFSPTSAWSPLLDAARTCNYSELHRLFDALLFP